MTSVVRIVRATGRAMALRGNDIDTDRVIPARFLKVLTFDGIEAHVFEDDRAALTAEGQRHPFDDPANRGAAVLVVQANFGCGSSREHAPQAIARWGIKAIVGESFAEIFFNNAVAIGLPCVTASPRDIAALFALAEKHDGAITILDLDARTVSAGGATIPVALPDSARDALMSGDWDVTGRLLERYDEVEAAAGKIRYIAGF